MVLFAKVVHSTLALLPFFVFIEKRLGQHWIVSYLKLFIHLIYTSFTIVVFIDVHGKSRVAALPRIFHPLN